MINFRIRINRNLINTKIKSLRTRIQTLPKELWFKFVQLTPIDTGYARRMTKLISNRLIRADYPYAQVLDRGRHSTPRGMRGSLQAPRGMTRPLRVWYKQRLRQILNQARRR